MQNREKNLLLGAHMPIAHGLLHALQLAEEIGCTTMQVFTKNNRQWEAKLLNSYDAVAFQDACKKSSIHVVVAHASYLINIGPPDKQTAEKSYKALMGELKRCDMLAIPYLVLHPGAHLKTDITTCLDQIASYATKALLKTETQTTILFETMAGQGSTVGNTFEQLAYLLKNTHAHTKQTGVCLDTCHIFAAGYDFSTAETYKTLWKNFDHLIGMKHLKVIHCNDSVKPLGGHLDRHTAIGKGAIGLDGFRLLMNDQKLIDIPKIIETPLDSLDDHRKNLSILKKLIRH